MDDEVDKEEVMLLDKKSTGGCVTQDRNSHHGRYQASRVNG